MAVKLLSSLCSSSRALAGTLLRATATGWLGLAILIPSSVMVVEASPSVNPNTLTVSGISGGAAFALQYEVAFSSTVRAAGIVAGLPYLCAEGTVAGAETCMNVPELIENAALLAEAETVAADQWIDPLSNMASHAVMLFSGLLDTVVAHGAMLKVEQQLRLLGLGTPTTGPLKTYFNYSAEHAWVTDFFGNDCNHLGTPFLNDCALDFAGEFLRMAFRHMLQPYNESTAVSLATTSSRLFSFDQSFFGASALMSMAPAGFVYVPEQCSATNSNSSSVCHVHVNFHGCEQDNATIGPVYVNHTGLNRRAEVNGIIVLYPQTIPSSVVPYNPKGCFDWWGYSGENYALQHGAQMAVVHSMVEYIFEHGTLPGIARSFV